MYSRDYIIELYYFILPIYHFVNLHHTIRVSYCIFCKVSSGIKIVLYYYTIDIFSRQNKSF